MKKLALFLILALSVPFLYGCTQSTAPTGAIPGGSAANCASSVGQMVFLTGSMNSLGGSFIGVYAMSKALETTPTIVYTDGWWTFTYAPSTVYTYTFKMQLYKADGTEILALTGADAITNKMKMAVTLAYGSTMTYTFGTTSDPVVVDGILTGASLLFSGPVTLSVTDSTGTYNANLTYSAVAVSKTTGYPTSGSSTFSISGSGFETVAGTITYAGATATIAITSPSSIAGNYTLNMTTGAVTPASM